MIPATLTHYIETEIIPRHEHFDKAHNLAHVRTVIEESLALAKEYNVNESMAYTIAAYHDTGLCRDRATHHLISGEILKQDKMLCQWFSEEEIETMKEAVEDHRASTDHKPRSIYGKIVAEADRVIDPVITLRRTVQYGLKQKPEAEKEWHYQRFRQHLMEKCTGWISETLVSEIKECRKAERTAKDYRRRSTVEEYLPTVACRGKRIRNRAIYKTENISQNLCNSTLLKEKEDVST